MSGYLRLDEHDPDSVKAFPRIHKLCRQEDWQPFLRDITDYASMHETPGNTHHCLPVSHVFFTELPTEEDSDIHRQVKTEVSLYLHGNYSVAEAKKTATPSSKRSSKKPAEDVGTSERQQLLDHWTFPDREALKRFHHEFISAHMKIFHVIIHSLDDSIRPLAEGHRCAWEWIWCDKTLAASTRLAS